MAPPPQQLKGPNSGRRVKLEGVTNKNGKPILYKNLGRKGFSEAKFSLRGGLHSLFADLKGTGADSHMSMSEEAKALLNSLAAKLVEKFAQTISKSMSKMVVSQGKKTQGQLVPAIVTDRDLKFAARLIIGEKNEGTLYDLNNKNVSKCMSDKGCDSQEYTDRTIDKKCLKTYGSGKKKERKMKALRFSVTEITQLAKSYGIGRLGPKGQKDLAIRVQHLIGEVLGMAIATAKAQQTTRVSEEHIKMVLACDEELKEVFDDADSLQTAAQSIGVGIVDLPLKKMDDVLATDPKMRKKYFGKTVAAEKRRAAKSTAGRKVVGKAPKEVVEEEDVDVYM